MAYELLFTLNWIWTKTGLRLSAYLYDITSNQTYYDATIRSRDFMQSHLYNTSGGYIVDSFNPATCGYAGSAAVTYKMGLYLEALSVFADTTSNSTLFQLSVDTFESMLYFVFDLTTFLVLTNSLWMRSSHRYGWILMESYQTLQVQ